MIRIIPARAGFTQAYSRRTAKQPDHPRSRGVYRLSAVSFFLVAGSSPLARGLPSYLIRHFGNAGIIPARAGFTGCHPRCDPRRGDHPRSRGVYRVTPAASATDAGSSPLARGLRGLRDRDAPRPGIIPARAGFTRPAKPVGRLPRDHPRSRGVYFLRSTSMAAVPGSSPLARGLPTGVQRGHADARIIPARAGFTPCRRLHRCRPSDHPRSRGVYAVMTTCRGSLRGSSPLARGLRHRAQHDVGHRRIIPARAGFTCKW